MNESLTVVIERNAEFTSGFVTEPYEVAWAREGRWFLVLDAEPGSGVGVRLDTEISPDGLNWCPLEEASEDVSGLRVSTWPVREFGGWLRVRGTISGASSVKGSLYLALKA